MAIRSLNKPWTLENSISKRSIDQKRVNFLRNCLTDMTKSIWLNYCALKTSNLPMHYSISNLSILIIFWILFKIVILPETFAEMMFNSDISNYILNLNWLSDWSKGINFILCLSFKLTYHSYLLIWHFIQYIYIFFVSLTQENVYIYIRYGIGNGKHTWNEKKHLEN